ncbi:MAG: helix-turn-helix domain-containing protein [Streptomycetales bacterium]
MSTPQPGSGPTVLRIMLGSQLRRLREQKGIAREAAGFEIRSSESKISRMELGRVSFKERDVSDLLALYGVSAVEREALVALVRHANTPGWWQSFSDVLPAWFQAYVDLEEAASRIRTYEVQFVPGLLQTPDYARAVVGASHTEAPAEDVERVVSLRMRRQQILTRPDPPRMWAVIDEAPLRRPIGGPEVMRGQLEHLLAVAALPNVTVQVVPFHAGGHAAEAGAFSLLRFPEADLPDVVYLEQLTGALYLDKREDVDHYTRVMERLTVQAAPPCDTIKVIEGVLAET